LAYSKEYIHEETVRNYEILNCGENGMCPHFILFKVFNLSGESFRIQKEEED